MFSVSIFICSSAHKKNSLFRLLQQGVFGVVYISSFRYLFWIGKSAETYFILFSFLFPEFRQRLRINDAKGDPLLIVCPDLPEHYRDRLIRSLEVSCPRELCNTDSKAKGKDYTFTTYHFTWWNRYAPDVCSFFSFFFLFRIL